jgi:hypothetical protein
MIKSNLIAEKTDLLTAEKSDLSGGRAGKIIYWIATAWLSLGMLSTGAAQIFEMKGSTGGIDSIVHLGYPVYILMILGVWKILGVAAVLIPKFPLLKEWAYAGFFFVMTGAILSHISAGDAVKEVLPGLLLLVLTLVSWYFRPPSRKITAVKYEYKLDRVNG